MSKILKIATAFIGTFGAGLAGMIFVNSGVGSWYAGLVKPPFTPPEIIFPFAWLVLYFLMAAACSIVWLKHPQTASTEGWVRFFFVQLLLNGGWTIFFFGFHGITVALIDALVLEFFIVGLCASAWSFDRRITYLMLPYALWTLFVIYLSAGVWLLN